MYKIRDLTLITYRKDMKIIIKSRIGECLIPGTTEKQYQLQFKAEGENLYNGFSIDTFETTKEAELALNAHVSGQKVYKPFATLGGMCRYFMCKVII